MTVIAHEFGQGWSDLSERVACVPTFTRRHLIGGAGATIVLGLASGGLAAPSLVAPSRVAPVFPGLHWATRTPSQLGLSAAKLASLKAATGNRIGFIVRDGYLGYSWGDVDAKFDWSSAAKPVVSTLLLFALKERRILSVDDRVARWGWPLKAKDQSMTLRHLACMVSGYALPERPGAAWGYNDYAIRLYKKTVFDRIFAQSADAVARNAQQLGVLGLEDGTLFSGRGSYGVTTSVRDFARIGWFWLNKGRWAGRQLLPRAYFDTYCRNQVPAGLPRTRGGLNDYLHVGTDGGGTNRASQAQGFYGFNWWFNTNHRAWPDALVDTFQARGHCNEETIVVIPSLGIVGAWRGLKSDPGVPALRDANRFFHLLADTVI